MSELHDAAAAILAVWQSEGKAAAEPIGVAELLDRLFPYAQARRRLGIDVSEDYEALMLRLLAEEAGLATVTPGEAAELARVTMAEKLPDLAVLQLLRGARLVLHVDPARIVPIPPPPPPPPEGNARWRAETASAEATSATSEAPAICWSCDAGLPTGRSVKFCPLCGADQRPPVCAQCHEPLERGWKHCPECGARVERPATPP